MARDTTTVGGYLASRLAQIGLRHYFAVPGDYNLVLLDELLKNDDLQMVSCCNELNAGYAADGYARATGGPAAAVVTYSVGGLSLINAVAGAYAEDMPLIAISGGPNTNSEAEYEFLHHTLGEVDYGYQRDMFERVTVESVVLQHALQAPEQIDNAIETALVRRKPVYIEVACNLSGATTSAPQPRDFATVRTSDARALAAAVAHAAELLNGASRPVLVAGVKLRPAAALGAFRDLAEAAGYAVATMPNAKGFFPESHPHHMGTYWGSVSDVGCSEIVEAADVALFAGPVFNDYTTSGHELGIKASNLIRVMQSAVTLEGALYSDVAMADFLTALARQVARNEESVKAFERVRAEPAPRSATPENDPLTVRQLFGRVEDLLDGRSLLVAETGDSWFNGMGLTLPDGARFEIQMQYGSIGWSVGATLGLCLGSHNRRVVACIGDGSFQMTAQELSTMIRYGVDPIIFLINNGGYTIEVEIHDGPYNTIKNWSYAGLIDVFNADDGQGWGCRVATASELDEAISTARNRKGVSLIEVMIDRDDCNRDLLRWGNRVARNNGRPPRHP
jgi:TPP-dependent 2-oxoacid decarboxylase